MRQLSFIVTYKQALFKQEIRPQERTGKLVYDVKTVLKTLKRGRKIHRKSTGDYKMMYFKFFSEGKKFYIIKDVVLYNV